MGKQFELKRFTAAWAKGLNFLPPHKLLLLWGDTYTCWDERFSNERLIKFEQAVENLDW